VVNSLSGYLYFGSNLFCPLFCHIANPFIPDITGINTKIYCPPLFFPYPEGITNNPFGIREEYNESDKGISNPIIP